MRRLPYPETSLKKRRLTAGYKQAKTVHAELVKAPRPATTKLSPNGYRSPPVIPAKAGIQGLFLSAALERRALDSRLRGNDDVFCLLGCGAQVGSAGAASVSPASGRGEQNRALDLMQWPG